MKLIPYQSFDKFLLRVPFHPIDKLNNLLKSIDGKDNPVKLFQEEFDPVFKEALFVASPHLYDAAKKMLYSENEIAEDDVLVSLLKYITRMSSRCTPFGIFSGCCIGNFTDFTSVNIGADNMHRTSTRLDMELIVAIIRQLEKNEEIKELLQYSVNSSVYSIGDQYRYVDYYYKGKERIHVLSSIVANDSLAELLKITSGNKKYDRLKEAFLELGDEEEVKEYLSEVINCKLLISELDIGSTGNQLLPETILKLESSGYKGGWLPLLEEVNKQLTDIDVQPIGRTLEDYETIISRLSANNIDGHKYLFQSDLSISTNECSIDKIYQAKVLEGISVLNRLNHASHGNNLNAFISEFYARYEEEEIPLSEALDTDIGIGFSSGDKGKRQDINEWLEDVEFKKKKMIITTVPVSDVDRYLMEKYESWCLHKHPDGVILRDEELGSFPENWNDVPNTIFAITEILNVIDKGSAPLLSISFAGGTSGATILGRFCHLDEEIDAFAREIIAVEDKLAEGYVLAEISHMPQDRVGNILLRPRLRKYEIPYLSNSSVSEEYKIPVTDLMVSVRNGVELRIRSKRLNKYVIPRLTSSHNYATNALPMYYFLGAVQSQHLRNSFKFQWGDLLTNKVQLPRVTYKDIVLAPARWNVNYSSLISLMSKNQCAASEAVAILRNSLSFPDRVVISHGDNKLMIDFNSMWSVKVFVSELKSQKFLLLEEFLFKENNFLAKRGADSFCNQVILFFKKEKQ
jgi:hypothetical protein